MSIDDISIQQRKNIEEKSLYNQSNYFKDSEYYFKEKKSSIGSADFNMKLEMTN